MNNIQTKINKLLTAIRQEGIDIKIDTLEFYSDTTEKYFKIYKVFIKEIVKNKKGELVYKYVEDDEFTTKIALLKYLVWKYKSLKKEGEANG